MYLSRCLLFFIFLLGSLQPLPVSAYAETSHLVRNGDTLWSISKKYGVSAKSIARANSLGNPHKLDIGQKLFIPSTVFKREPVATIPVVENETWNFQYDAQTLLKLLQVPTRRNQWRYIVIHHSATPNGSAKAFDSFHRQKRHMRNGLAYHFVVGNGNGAQDGKIEVGNRWKQQLAGGHCSNQKMNEVGIGICLVGNFQAQRPTSRQLQSLSDLVRHLQREYSIPKSRVILHKEVKQKSTLCPGKHFPADTFRRMLL